MTARWGRIALAITLAITSVTAACAKKQPDIEMHSSKPGECIADISGQRFSLPADQDRFARFVRAHHTGVNTPAVIDGGNASYRCVGQAIYLVQLAQTGAQSERK